MARTRISEFRQRIEHHLARTNSDIVCRKRNDAYNLVRADDRTLLAKLKPTGQGDEVEIFWRDGNRWREVDEFGCVLPLAEALDLVLDDPDGLFLDAVKSEEPGPFASPPRAIADAFSSVVLAAAVGGSLAGCLWSPLLGCVVGAVLAYVVFMVQIAAVMPHPNLAVRLSVMLAGPVVLAAAVSGTLGAALNEAVATVWWGRLAGGLIGGLCGVLIHASRPLGWALSFLAGVLLAISSAAALGLTHLHGVCLLAALLAMGLVRAFTATQANPIVAFGRDAFRDRDRFSDQGRRPGRPPR